LNFYCLKTVQNRKERGMKREVEKRFGVMSGTAIFSFW